MLLEILVYGAIAAFVSITVLGHLLVFQALFAKADTISGKTDRMPDGALSDSRA